MGSLFSKKQPKPSVTKSKAQEQVQNVDVVKSKLKISRDKVNNIIKAKNSDIDKIDVKIKQQLPEYQETGNKKKIVPLLKAKKDLQTFVQNAEVRVKLLNDKLSQVQMQQVNVDPQTINALDDSNKFIKDIQNQMEKKDWQGIIDQAKNKYELQWPEEDVEEDPAFQALWDELGGNKIDKKVANKKVEGKTVKVEIPVQVANDRGQKQVALA